MRKQAGGAHTIRIGAETYARAILAAVDQRKTVHEFAEAAIREALIVHDRMMAHNQQRDEWRLQNGTSKPKPMQTQARPSDGFSPRQK